MGLRPGLLGKGLQAAEVDDRGSRGLKGASCGEQTRPSEKSPNPHLREKNPRPLSPLTLTLKSMLQPPEVISVIHISDQENF